MVLSRLDTRVTSPSLPNVAGARSLGTESWRAYFAGLAGCSASYAAVDVLSSSAADGHSARARPLRGISYDPGHHVIELQLRVAGATLRHFISDPREIRVSESGEGSPNEILVQDATGVCTRIRFSERERLNLAS
jgi:hypothetical protein